MFFLKEVMAILVRGVRTGKFQTLLKLYASISPTKRLNLKKSLTQILYPFMLFKTLAKYLNFIHNHLRVVAQTIKLLYLPGNRFRTCNNYCFSFRFHCCPNCVWKSITHENRSLTCLLNPWQNSFAK